jgi:hypothetical protein
MEEMGGEWYLSAGGLMSRDKYEFLKVYYNI